MTSGGTTRAPAPHGRGRPRRAWPAACTSLRPRRLTQAAAQQPAGSWEGRRTGPVRLGGYDDRQAARR